MALLSLDPRTAFGLVGVSLALLGGCGIFGAPKIEPGYISGVVAVQSADLTPVTPLGWVVKLSGVGYQADVAANGTYVVNSVPAGQYDVILQPPPSDNSGGESVYSCAPAGCVYRDVQVATATATLHVDFKADAIPAPPF